MVEGGLCVLPLFGAEEADDEPADKGGGEKGGGGEKIPVEVVARQAVGELVMPEPVIRTSPDEKRAQLVRVPTWLWIDKGVWEPVSKTVKVPGVSVTATATPVETIWATGDGSSVVCEGPGTPYAKRFAADASSPDCGHTYRRSSAGQPDDAYTLTATIVWDVHWHGGGQQGAVPGLQTQAEVPLRVAEAQALVTDGA